jgi:hypothetical protein
MTTNRFQSPIIPGNVQGTFVFDNLGQVTGMRWTQSGMTGLYSKKRLASTLSIQLIGPEVHLHLRGDTGINYVTQKSADLRQWTGIATNTIWDPGIIDPVSSNGSRFYRVREP